MFLFQKTSRLKEYVLRLALLALLATTIASCTGTKPPDIDSPSFSTSPAPSDAATKATPPDTYAEPILDWSVPGRFDASWWSFSGLSGEYNRRFVNPDFWPVNLDACQSKSKNPINEYAFELWKPGDDKALFQRTSKNCRVSVDSSIRSEGDYLAKLTLHTKWLNGEERSSRVHSEIVKVDDRLIVVLGDSLAAGEGVPDGAGTFQTHEDRWGKIIGATQKSPVEWQNRQCHRSKKSGPALAAKALENKHTSVTFLTVACSGAQIWHLIDTPYRGSEPYKDWWIPPQMDVIKKATGKGLDGKGRQIDALILSAGINDLYFGDIVDDCAGDLVRWKGNCVTHRVCQPKEDADSGKRPGHYGHDAHEADVFAVPKGFFGTDHVRCFGDGTIDGQVDELPALYKELQNAIRMKLPDVREVYISDYPAIVFLGGACGKLHIHTGVGIGEKEGLSMYNWGLRLSGKIAEAGHRFRSDAERWNRIDPLTEVFRNHEYCASGGEGWFRHYETSWQTQGNEKGTAHPNEAGHAAYGKALYRAISSDVNTSPLANLTITVKAIKSAKYEVGLLALQQYQNDDYSLQTHPAVPADDQWTAIPPEIGTFHLMVYPQPTVPRHATEVRLTMGGQTLIHHTRDQVYGAGVPQQVMKDLNYQIEVQYSVKIGPPP